MDCIAFWWGRYGFSSPSTKGFHGRARCRLIDITNLEVWWIKDNLLLWRGLQIRLYQKQRDQIWRNFATLAKLCKSLGNFSKLNLVLEKNQQSLVKLVCFWANLHCCKWPNIENNLAIWSHWSDQKSADILNDTGLNIVLLCIVFGNCYFTFWFPPKQCDEKIPPNIFTSCPKMISQEKW